jgi:predicted DCC family thiol-disulfide oxidoreductase YuxK|tara:strand:+ start:594 stop:971 length:378 start_codon:yes stop_codon:yes gene_type:complete
MNKENKAAELILFFDGRCPLCTKEITLLQRYDKNAKIQFEDINSTSFETRFPFINLQEARDVLHGQLLDGTIIRGMDVTFMAWDLVKHHRWLKLLNLPLVRPLTDWVYQIFARHRSKIANFLIRK